MNHIIIIIIIIAVMVGLNSLRVPTLAVDPNLLTG